MVRPPKSLIELSIFVPYVDSDTHKINEEILGMAEVIGSKGREALFIFICEVLANKGIDINQMRLDGMNGTNTTRGEHCGLKRRFRHKIPHKK